MKLRERIKQWVYELLNDSDQPAENSIYAKMNGKVIDLERVRLIKNTKVDNKYQIK